MNVAIVGASNKPDRYSYLALRFLKAQGHTPYPVHPRLRRIENMAVFPSLSAIPAPLDVVTVYVAPRNQGTLAAELLRVRPRRVIFNPGAENPPLAARLQAAGIQTVDACTLVLLKTGQFEF